VVGRHVALRACHDQRGGQGVGESPRTAVRVSNASHEACKAACPPSRGLPSVPLSVGTTGGRKNHSERRSPCARIC
jgi:hypothetical protein